MSDLYAAAKTFADLLFANRLFLGGKIYRTPWHCEPIDEETYPLVKMLIMINNHILTTCSQPHTEHQRAFIDAIVPNELVDKIIKNLDQNKYIIITSHNDQLQTIHNDYKPMVQMLGGDKCINLTREIFDTENKEDMDFVNVHSVGHEYKFIKYDKKIIRYYSNIWIDDTPDDQLWYLSKTNTIADSLRATTTNMRIIAINYNTPGLFEDMCKILI